MSKEIIDLLEKNSRVLRAIYEEKEIPMPDDLEKLSFNNNQALTLLKQQPTAGEKVTLGDRLKGSLKYCKEHKTIILSKLPCPCCVQDRLDRAEAEIKAKDTLLFAYESVKAPVNPLISINKDLLVALEEAADDFYYIHQHPEDAHTDSYNFMEKVKQANKEG